LLLLVDEGMLKLMDLQPVKASITKAKQVVDKKVRRFMDSSF
jgi:hypothetical protein